MTSFDDTLPEPLSGDPQPVFTADDAVQIPSATSKLNEESKAVKKVKVPRAPRVKKTTKLDADVAAQLETLTDAKLLQAPVSFQDDDFEELLAIANKELASSTVLPKTSAEPLPSTASAGPPPETEMEPTLDQAESPAVGSEPDQAETVTHYKACTGFDMDMLDVLTADTPGSKPVPIPMTSHGKPHSNAADHGAFDMEELEALALGAASRFDAGAGANDEDEEEGSGEACSALAPPKELTLHEKLAEAALEHEEPQALKALVAESRTPRRGGLLLVLAERAVARAEHAPDAAGQALRRVCEALGPWHSQLAKRLALKSSEHPQAYPTLALLDRESRIHPDPAYLAASVTSQVRPPRRPAP